MQKVMEIVALQNGIVDTRTLPSYQESALCRDAIFFLDEGVQNIQGICTVLVHGTGTSPQGKLHHICGSRSVRIAIGGRGEACFASYGRGGSCPVRGKGVRWADEMSRRSKRWMGSDQLALLEGTPFNFDMKPT